jgi:hypothetical protein
MPQLKEHFEYNAFGKGINTEASLINFPADYSRDEENYELDKNNTRSRRLGMDYEDSFTAQTTGIYLQSDTTKMLDYAVTTHFWKASDNSFYLYVIQIGTVLYFFDWSIDGALSDNYVTSFTISGANADQEAQADVWRNNLLVASGEGLVRILSYSPLTQTVTGTTTTLNVRDIWGVDDGLATGNNPASLSDKHNYNLQNQGWSSTNITSYNSAQSAYPSNAEQAFWGKTRDSAFDSNEIIRQYFGDTPAPKGSIIIDFFDRGNSRATATSISVSSLGYDISYGGPTDVVVHAGRAFYCGGSVLTTDGDDDSPSASNTILFSRLIEGANDIGKCYQEADPTSEHISDLIQTDGGSITIADAKEIKKLLRFNNTLLVFATNGVWQVKNPNGGVGFRADEYQVIKIYNAPGIVATNSLVVTETDIFYWASDAIYHISQDDYGNFIAQDMSSDLIRNIYTPIDDDVKQYAKGHYDIYNRKITWLYSLDTDFDGYSYTDELVFNLYNKGFTKRAIKSLSSNSPFVSGYVDHRTDVSSVITGEEPTVKYVAFKPNVITSTGVTNTITAYTETSGGTQTVGAYRGYDFDVDWDNNRAYTMTGDPVTSDDQALKVWDITNQTQTTSVTRPDPDMDDVLGDPTADRSMEPLCLIGDTQYMFWAWSGSNGGPLFAQDVTVTAGTTWYNFGSLQESNSISNTTNKFAQVIQARSAKIWHSTQKRWIYFIMTWKYDSKNIGLLEFNTDFTGGKTAGLSYVYGADDTNYLDTTGANIKLLQVGNRGTDTDGMGYVDFWTVNEDDEVWRIRVRADAYYDGDAATTYGVTYSQITLGTGTYRACIRDEYDDTLIWIVDDTTDRVEKRDSAGTLSWSTNLAGVGGQYGASDYGIYTVNYSKAANGLINIINGSDLVTIDTTDGSIDDTNSSLVTVSNDNWVTNTLTGQVLYLQSSVMKEVAVDKGTVYEVQLTFSSYNNTSFLDWYTQDSTGVDAAAYIKTGPFNFEDNTRDKSILYLFVQFERAETGQSGGSLTNPGGCTVQAFWGHHDNSSSKKVTTAQSCYRVAHYIYPDSTYSDTNFVKIPEVVITKNKLRGAGKSVALKFATQSAKDCKLMGWTIPVMMDKDE